MVQILFVCLFVCLFVWFFDWRLKPRTPSLLRFVGRQQDLSWGGWWSKTLSYRGVPFDRHDWFVDPWISKVVFQKKCQCVQSADWSLTWEQSKTFVGISWALTSQDRCGQRTVRYVIDYYDDSKAGGYWMLDLTWNACRNLLELGNPRNFDCAKMQKKRRNRLRD